MALPAYGQRSKRRPFRAVSALISSAWERRPEAGTVVAQGSACEQSPQLNRICLYRELAPWRFDVKRSLYVACAFLAFGCSAATAGGKNVRVERAEPPANCEQISVISAYASNTGNDDESVREKLRNQAAASGANYVRLDKLGGSNTLKEGTGTAYKCPPGK